MAPWWAWIISWLTNVIVISIIVAIIDMKENYIIERLPWAGFFLAFVIPTVFELICWWGENKPFMELLVPGFRLLY
ncbi:MAG: hypothetical protein J7K68_04990 [Candidatus Diapherotrites archaeon]|nr:hypothetical protein [Candidatus Diapherotrites archaeon]